MVLFHDTYSSTVDLVYQFIPVLKANGYHLVTVSHMLGPRAPGTSYGSRDNGPPVNDLRRHPARRVPALPTPRRPRRCRTSRSPTSRRELRRPQQRRVTARMTTDTAFVLTLLVLCYAVVSGLVKRWYLAPALIFVLFGMVLGPFGFNVLEGGPDAATFTVLAQLALTVILFNQAAELDLSAVVVAAR